jgi:hypothetical protein
MGSLLKNCSNKYLRFTFRSIVLIFLIVFSDQLIGRLLKHFYFKQIAGASYRANFAIDSTHAQILIFGSSRANHHYVPQIFEDSLNLSCYNVGRDGSFLLYNYAIFKIITDRYSPKIIIVDIMSEDLNYNTDSYSRLSVLLPYYRDHPEIRDIILLRNRFEKFKLLSQIYPYNSEILHILLGNLELSKKIRDDQKGYVPLYSSLKDTIPLISVSGYGLVDNNKVKALNDIISICKQKDIELVFVTSPIFYRIKHNHNQLLDSIIIGAHLKYYYFLNNDQFLKNPYLFQDFSHLNNEGAMCFSRMLAAQLKKEEL